jgi:CheY-like chemotaxis protein
MVQQRPQRPSLKYQLAGQDQSGATGPKVLVVDDDPDMTRLVSAALNSGGFAAIVAYDALQGMQVAQRDRPSLIIIDLHMPAGGGLKLLEKLQASGKTAETPVLVVTADAASDLPRQAQALGARGFLRKPLDLPQLVQAVAFHLQQPPAE